MSIGFRALLHRLFREDSGQDLVEYALLTMVVGFAGAVAAPYVSNAISYAYGTWVDSADNIWESPDPAGS
jgi:hypothetical protein